MLAIKFKRVGKKKQASFRVVITEKRSKLTGRFVEDIGWYNPHTDEFGLKDERVKYWLGVGAQPTDSVHNLLVRAGIITGPKIAVHSTKKKKKPASAEVVEDKKETPAETLQEPETASEKKDSTSEELESKPQKSVGKEKQEEEEPPENKEVEKKEE